MHITMPQTWQKILSKVWIGNSFETDFIDDGIILSNENNVNFFEYYNLQGNEFIKTKSYERFFKTKIYNFFLVLNKKKIFFLYGFFSFFHYFQQFYREKI